MKTVELSTEEMSALAAALDYYIDTLNKCHIHDEGEHGDEINCDGWGPKELAILIRAADKVTR